jgi:Spore cortex protein YabQ (Spore_YabQ).
VGVGLGAYYDVFRIGRLVFHPGKRQNFILDFIYMLTSGLITFILAVAVNYGEVRFYIIAGEIIGWCAYHLTIGQLTLLFSTLIIKAVRAVNKFIHKYIMGPIKKALRTIARLLIRIIRIPFVFLKKSYTKFKNRLKQNNSLVYNQHNNQKKRKRKTKRKKGGVSSPVRRNAPQRTAQRYEGHYKEKKQKKHRS